MIIQTVFSNQVFAQIVQVNIQHPPYNQLHLEDLWNITLNNITPNPLQIFLQGTLTETDEGIIATAQTNVFLLNPGMKIFTGNNVHELEPLSVDFSNPDPRYEESVIRTGGLPGGIYELCVSVILADDGNEIGFDCIQQMIESTASPTLISPGNEEPVALLLPAFTWLHNTRPGNNAMYKLRITEILEGQSPEISIQNNPAWFEEDGITSTIFVYPSIAREFLRGTQYAWVVQAFDQFGNPMGENQGRSEVWSFIYNYSIQDTTKPDTTMYISGDGTKVPLPVLKTCMLKLTVDPAPKMDGGLSTVCLVKDMRIYRDEFIPLIAEGKDYDQLLWECIPHKNCNESSSKCKTPLSGRVDFEWEIIEGEGYLVQIGCLPESKKAVGKHIIFKPPYVGRRDKNNKPGKKVTKIVLRIVNNVNKFTAEELKGFKKKGIDSLTASQMKKLTDSTKTKTIIITTKRAGDKYKITVESKPPKTPKKPAKIIPTGENLCLCEGPDWQQKNDLINPVVILPTVKDSIKIAATEWIILQAKDTGDNDVTPLICDSRNCTGEIKKIAHKDNVQWEWKVDKGGGKFVTGPKKSNRSSTVYGRFVIYEAPKLGKKDNIKTVTISVKIYNPDGLQANDAPKTTKFNLKIVKPGIIMEPVDADWIPEDSTFVDVTSSLVYTKDGERWQPALEHMCRIIELNLAKVSTEPGKCMNFPTKKKANTCRDLRISDGVSFNLAGRQIIKHPDILDLPGSDARVVFNINVDGQGKVKTVELNESSTTLDDAEAINSLKGAVKKSKFDKRSDRKEQAGTITINFYGHEASEDSKTKGCKGSGYYLKAQTKKSLNKYSISIFSEDYGSFGVLYSAARDYYTVPFTTYTVTHPQNRRRHIFTESKLKNSNLVTIPRDIDWNHIPDNGWTAGADVNINDPADNEADQDATPKGDGTNGDGLTNYQEYRGFMMSLDGRDNNYSFIRTNNKTKDLFIYNKDNLPTELFETASGLDVHRINKNQIYLSKSAVKGRRTKRIINFNAKTAHLIYQNGLKLINHALSLTDIRRYNLPEGTVLGVAISTIYNKKNYMLPAPPNFIDAITVDTARIIKMYRNTTQQNRRLKIRQIVAHELGHGLNVYHHGEMDGKDPSPLRGGNRNCVMRYDNYARWLGEPIGTTFCRTASGVHGRGNCAHQFRIYSADRNFPKR